MELPAYRDLPIRDDLPPRSAWGVFADGRLGAQPPRLAEATAGLACAVAGEVHALTLDLSIPDPPLFGRGALSHRVLGVSGESHDDELSFNTQSSSQWDGFRHVAHPEHGYFDGLADAAHGIDAAARGIVGRGVLLDVGRARNRRVVRCAWTHPRRSSARTSRRRWTITASRFGRATCCACGPGGSRGTGGSTPRAVGRAPRSSPRAGSPRPTSSSRSSGTTTCPRSAPTIPPWRSPLGGHLDRDERRRRWTEGRPDLVFGHLSILALLVDRIGELFDLDGWAAAADAGRHDALFVSAPLPVTGGVASPPNALAIR